MCLNNNQAEVGTSKAINVVRRQRKWAKLVFVIMERLASFDFDIKPHFLGIASGGVAAF